MSDDKKVTDKAGEIARNIWLAGVGAYGRAVEEAQGRLEKAMEPPKLFRDLVKAGAALEEEARVSTTAARHSVEERINKVRENFHNQRPARIEDLMMLQKKVDQLSRKVDSLRRALENLSDGAGMKSKSPEKPAGKSSVTRTQDTRTKRHTTGKTKTLPSNKRKPNKTSKRIQGRRRRV